MNTLPASFATRPAAAARVLPESLALGTPALAGSVHYDAADQIYRVVGAGANIWLQEDDGWMAARRWSGDGVLRAQVAFCGRSDHAHRKIGVMWRADAEGGSPHVSAVAHADGLISLQFRRTRGAKTEQIVSPASGADVLQLERRGNAFVMSAARFGEPWTVTVLEDGPDLGVEVLAALAVCSHDAAVTEEVVFRNVRLFRVATPELRPYRDYLPSELEFLDPATGHARSVLRCEGELQAPNWSPDGATIDMNREGLIHRLDLRTAGMAVVDTGEAKRNNNDHVLSADGRWLGISHHSQEGGRMSLVYVVPVEGGAPRLVTEQGPSYLHGWSPDGASLIYTAKRAETGEALNIYRIPAAGGAEERLSDGPGLDDGSEYSPDGKWIYFNSDRTGVMKIWRMLADGSGLEQVTHGELNDWFPHVSPDGRWLVFLSYQADVPARQHPFYQHVYVRRCALTGDNPKAGEARVVAYVYGGQGTFNVPSWSPDGTCVALISNGGVG